ncbi:polyketide cyclase [Polymorphobacter arshaanensis]|uniref:Polyketide cyclase n=1 Tax=Glacieibacterium arshaanense TaxID=2511025 RepID=A0A4Y9EMV5_9SPHN|nr:SRPBCC family protein [Polymorphobacter arshaanensis]TFU03358.1 polyketide cyclase [Polymorphobacter arshaanensis]
MFRILTVVVALALAVLFGRAALSSGDFQVESARVIEAAPKDIMPYLDNFHGWAGWWPPERQNPGLVAQFSGSASGPGATYDWSTGGVAGAGRMTIIAEQPDLLTIAVDQRRPLVTQATMEFRLAKVDDGTRVTVKHTGHHDLWTRLRHPLGVDTDALETQLDDALTYLKLVVEGTEPS